MKGLTKTAKVPKGQGKIVWWVGISKVNPAGGLLTEGTDPTARSTAAIRVSGVLKEYGNLVKNSRLFMDTAIDGVKKQIIADLAKDAAKVLDDAVLAKALSGGTPLYAGSATCRSTIASNCTATITDIRKAVRLLQLSSVPRWPDGFYVGLVHPDVNLRLTSLNLPNSVKLLLCKIGQHRAKPLLGEGVTNIRETLLLGVKICSELHSNMQRIAAMLFRSLQVVRSLSL